MTIRLHPKHGLNPTVCQCFWCGEAKNELALLGANYRGEAPMRMVLDYEPCNKCREGMALGITIIGVSDKPFTNQQPPIQDGGVRLYPSGSWMVMKCHAFVDLFSSFVDDPAIVDDAVSKGKLFIEQALLAQLQSSIKDDNS